MEKKSVKDFDNLNEIVRELYYDMRGCCATSKSAGKIKLPDGRMCEVQIVVTAEEDEFIDQD